MAAPSGDESDDDKAPVAKAPAAKAKAKAKPQKDDVCKYPVVGHITFTSSAALVIDLI